MAWLDTIKDLSFILQGMSCNWICFFRYESGVILQHSAASDHSANPVSSSNQQVPPEEPRARCFFAMQPKIDCCEYSAENFFRHSAAKVAGPACFLIPYYSQDSSSVDLQTPFLRFGYEDWLEFSGDPDSNAPIIKSSGAFAGKILDSLSSLPSQGVIQRHRHNPADWHHSESTDSLLSMFEQLKEHMRNGDCYLANATTRMLGPARTELKVSMSEFVSQWISEPSRYGVYVNCGESWPQVVCYSPERFILRSGSFVQAEPIKGTALADQNLCSLGANSLWQSKKEMCEQKMVTDLLRNDLNKVCEPGSVVVKSPYEIRVAGPLLQMQSVVCGTLANSSIPNSDILMKTLPAGSVTGTPKYAVGQFISEIEKSPRGYYTGVFAQCDAESDFDSAILIRGFFAESNKWYAGVGAGITTLSDSAAEAVEFDLKWKSFFSRLGSTEEQFTPCKENLRHENEFTEFNKAVDPRIAAWLLSSRQNPKSPVPSQSGTPEQSVERTAGSPAGQLIELNDLQALHDLNDVLGERVLFIDHYDSFSENLIAALRARGLTVARIFSPTSKLCPAGVALTVADVGKVNSILREKFQGVVFSPGPYVPSDYPFSQELLRSLPDEIPVLGVCLGHQMLLTDSGLVLNRISDNPVHGRGMLLRHLNGSRLVSAASFKGEATFYNSWHVRMNEFDGPECPWLLCGSDENGAVLCEHRFLPRIVVQFHPESFATTAGRSLLDSFVDLITIYKIKSHSNKDCLITRTPKDCS